MPSSSPPSTDATLPSGARVATLTLGGGCFWCVEAVFLEVVGVTAVESGYAGGSLPDPTYEAVCTGTTGHIEVVRLQFDPARIALEQVLGIFFSMHDPTTQDRQGHDVGPQYRSVVFCEDVAQLQAVRAFVERLASERVFAAPIVTETALLPNYHRAEDVHQRYFEQHPGQGYCRAVVAPKVAHFRRDFAAFRRPR